MRKTVATSIIDQGLLSAATFAVNLVLIVQAEPAQFGRFVIGLSLFYIMMAVQNALVVTPVSVFIPGESEARKRHILRVLASVDLLVMLGAVTLAALAAFAMGFAGGVLMAMCAMIAFGLWRELARHAALACGDIRRFFILDVLFIAFSAVGVATLWRFTAPELACFAGIALGNIASLLLVRVPLGRDILHLPQLLNDYRAFWPKTRWSLLGAGSSEAQIRLHVFIVEILKNSAALGTLQAGRVLISPVSLLAVAWGRAARPKLAELLKAGDDVNARAVLHGGIALTMVAAGGYFTALYVAWDWIESLLFRGRYQDIGWIVLAWCCFGVLEAPVRCLNIFLQSQQRFRELAIIGVIAAITASALLLCLAFPGVPVIAAIGCLIAGELIMGAWLIKALYWRPSMRAPHIEVGHG